MMLRNQGSVGMRRIADDVPYEVMSQNSYHSNRIRHSRTCVYTTRNQKCAYRISERNHQRNHDLIKVEVANTNAEKERWLMFRNDIMPLDSAMILVYDKRQEYFRHCLLHLQEYRAGKICDCCYLRVYR